MLPGLRWCKDAGKRGEEKARGGQLEPRCATSGMQQASVHCPHGRRKRRLSQKPVQNKRHEAQPSCDVRKARSPLSIDPIGMLKSTNLVDFAKPDAVLLTFPTGHQLGECLRTSSGESSL